MIKGIPMFYCLYIIHLDKSINSVIIIFIFNLLTFNIFPPLSYKNRKSNSSQKQYFITTQFFFYNKLVKYIYAFIIMYYVAL